jgi:hypothetical protein
MNDKRTGKISFFFMLVRHAACGYEISMSVEVNVRVVVFNATFNNISVILWRSVLLEEETEIPEENLRPVASH